ncbi:PEP-CTERM protein-sorting domain-containing protein [Rubritalea squalenifaciens DSM 18772]|uniref:PEP-CTERM protein-sorting domain-containing protein n=1 Tax=Rubritalea squalenifaciens DSM 18772 TaxID=1123071 RepID=A0A1M6CDA1_9BACT|nr:PEP-CTERM sorting domain-containing protein [Rubritalea squalenifaciens]SHI58992.1 PEP-CTERM protein-sorting domain-containing protein [Rubritalea squalenifaciens DSM 18772]
MKKTILITILSGVVASGAQAAVLYDQYSTGGGLWTVDTDAAVDTFTNNFDNGGWNGTRYWYGMAGGSLQTTITESVEFAAVAGSEFDLSSITWNNYIFGQTAGTAEVDVEAFVNGNSLGTQTFNAFGSQTWDASGLDNVSSVTVSFEITETGSGAVSFFELGPNNAAGNGLLIEGSVVTVAVPEPSSTALIGLAGVGFLLRRRR